MSGYRKFSQSIAAISEGQQTEITTTIDGYEISLRSMAHGYYLFGKLPIALKNTEQDLQRHLMISMVCFNSFDASIAVSGDNDLYASQYISKPRPPKDLLKEVESLVNLIDVWADLDKNLQQQSLNAV